MDYVYAWCLLSLVCIGVSHILRVAYAKKADLDKYDEYEDEPTYEHKYDMPENAADSLINLISVIIEIPITFLFLGILRLISRILDIRYGLKMKPEKDRKYGNKLN